MTIKINHIRLRAATTSGLFGVDLPFSDGLNILRASNTKGKSTCMQAIIYGLGLERMLSPRREIPLPYVMFDHVKLRPEDDTGPAVIESWVSIEIENSRGECMTIERGVKGDRRDFRLVSTWDSPVLSKGLSSGERSNQLDYYVRDPGAAQEGAGFYWRLAQFIGWDLPKVPKFDGGVSPLYLETIFPLLFVEQKVGWSTIQGPFPTFFKIRDVAQRVIEFLLDLDAQRVRVQRRELELKLAHAEQQWGLFRKTLEEIVKGVIGTVQGVPRDPSAKITDDFVPLIELYRDGTLVPMRQYLEKVKEEFFAIVDVPIRKSGDIVEDLESKLEEVKARTDENNALRQAAFESVAALKNDLGAVTRRISSLDSDLKKNQDARKLHNYGSTLGSIVDTGHCPTCHQLVDGELLPPSAGETMALDENIAFIKAHIGMLKGMEKSVHAKCEELDRDLEALKEEGVRLRSDQRTIRSALVAPSSAPSELDIKRKMEIESEIDRLGSSELRVAEIVEELRRISTQVISVKAEMKNLPTSDIGGNDERKIEIFQNILRKQLKDYEFSTFSPSEITISMEHFRPYVVLRSDDEIEAETELTFQMSASDQIRLKWAYLLSLYEVGLKVRTNHPGILVFDEPRQQDADKISFAALIRNAQKAASGKHQIIFATSEEPEAVAELTSGLKVNVLNIEGFLLKPLFGKSGRKNAF